MSKKIPKLYIDTNVIISYFSDKEKFHTNANNFFEKIEKKKIKGVTSSINKTEFLAFFKKAYSTEYKKNPKDVLIEKILKFWNDLIDEMGLEYYESDKLIQPQEKFFSKAYDIVLRSKAVKKHKNWKFISGYDAMVIMMASKTHSDGIITNDDGYLGAYPKDKVKILRDEF